MVGRHEQHARPFQRPRFDCTCHCRRAALVRDADPHLWTSIAAAAPSPRSDPLIEVDVGSRIGEGAWSPYQKLVLLLCALAIVFDSFDNQVLSFTIPALINDWGVARSAFAPILAAGLISMSVGTALAGLLRDRFGRRDALVGSVFVFGLGTALIALVDSLWMLGVLRVIAGLGVGGAIPNAVALVAEYTPSRHRTVAVTLGMICVPLGGTICGVVATLVLPNFGWRALFLLAGLAAIAIAIILLATLPESPRYLVRRPQRREELLRILSRLRQPVPPEATFVDREESVEQVSLRSLVTAEHRRDTMALWVAFFFCLMATYTMSSWAPAMLSSVGFDLSVASSGLAAFNFGGIFGALAGAYVINRLGSRAALMGLCALGAVGAVLMIALPVLSTDQPIRVIAALAIEGAIINGAQTTLFALAAHIYPTSIRSSGIGSALAIGRFGAVLSSFMGAAALALHDGTDVFFGAVAAALLICMIALAFIRRHIPKLSAQQH